MSLLAPKPDIPSAGDRLSPWQAIVSGWPGATILTACLRLLPGMNIVAPDIEIDHYHGIKIT
jgi:hypothetical protein